MNAYPGLWLVNTLHSCLLIGQNEPPLRAWDYCFTITINRHEPHPNNGLDWKLSPIDRKWRWERQVVNQSGQWAVRYALSIMHHVCNTRIMNKHSEDVWQIQTKSVQIITWWVDTHHWDILSVQYLNVWNLTLKETVENFLFFSVCIPAFTVMIFLTGNCSSCLISFNLSFASFKIAHKWIPWLQRAIFSEQSTVFRSGANYNGEFPEVHQSRLRHKLLRAPDLQHEVEYRRLPKWHFSKLTAICQSAMLNKSGLCCHSLYADGR